MEDKQLTLVIQMDTKYPLNRKGLSQIVSTVLLILISMGLVIGVWATIHSFVLNRMNSVEACKEPNLASINNMYTCYNQTNKYTVVSIGVGDTPIDAMIISVDYSGNSKSFKLENSSKEIGDFYYYVPGYGINATEVKLPNLGSSRTFAINITGQPDSIKIYAQIDGKSCGTSASISTIPVCY